MPNCDLNIERQKLFFSQYVYTLKIVSDKKDFSVYGQKPTKRISSTITNIGIDVDK